jgi:hypothetical protein
VSDVAEVRKVARALEAIAQGLADLEAAGSGIPAVQCNVARLRGTLRQLEVQFGDLDAVINP